MKSQTTFNANVYIFKVLCNRRSWSAQTMRRDSHLSVQGACCLDIGFRHMFSALDGVTFSWCISRAVRFPSCAYTDASPGVGSLVGWELSESLDGG